jgi:urea carboxylase system permease
MMKSYMQPFPRSYSRFGRGRKISGGSGAWYNSWTVSYPRPADTGDVESFGYRQELARNLGSFSSFAAGFSYISILTGMFQMFHLGFATGGPAFFWSWPIVLAGQFLVALCFAELAARYPLSGGVYQWSKYVGNRLVGFLTGWIYLACLVVTLAAVALAMQSALPQIWSGFQIVATGQARDTAVNAVLLGCVLLAASTLINAFGVKLLTAINNVGVISELVGVVVLILLLARHAVRPASDAVLPTMGRGTGSAYMGPFLAAAALTASYVMYGFDTAGSLAEETHDPRRRAPRAILQALGAAGVSGLLVLLFTLRAAPDLHDPMLASADGGLPHVVKSVLGAGLGRIFLCDVAFAIFVCTLSVHTGTVRVMFAMARDGKLPFSGGFAKVSRATHIPVIPAITVGVGAILILVVNVTFPKIVELITAIAILWANLAYLLVVAAMLWHRLSGRTEARQRGFSLGRSGLAVNVLAMFWSAFMVVNVSWPRAAVYGEENRFAAVRYTAALAGAGGVWLWLRGRLFCRQEAQQHVR